MAIVRVSKDVTFLREKGGHSYNDGTQKSLVTEGKGGTWL